MQRRHEPGYERAPRPNSILLDLDLPRKDGRAVIRTTSTAEQDVIRAYDAQANCLITKPVDLDQFLNVIRSIEDFWLTTVTLPTPC